jgi:ubiquinone/menaquinone biosynthesis C-methylase UbiE
MNRGNADMNARALEHLALVGDSRVLEIGFGGGATLPKLLAVVAHVTGFDRADDMVEAAKRRHADEISAGRLRLDAGDIYELPYDDGSFDRILTVNTVYFWPDLHGAMDEIRRVMGPHGELVVGIRDPSVMQKVDRAIFTVREPEEVRDAVEAAGFTDAGIFSPPGTKYHLITASA